MKRFFLKVPIRKPSMWVLYPLGASLILLSQKEEMEGWFEYITPNSRHTLRPPLPTILKRQWIWNGNGLGSILFQVRHKTAATAVLGFLEPQDRAEVKR